MNKVILGLSLALFAGAAQAQSIPHEPVAHVCLTDGRCVEMPGGVMFPTDEACQIALPQLYSALVQHLMQRGLAPHVMTAEVVCEPMGIDG